ncbi:MAG: tetratricopeptide repeat protein [Deltaproteobacteria bacterium]|nr:tetratricopeptide repeat protein [Deltaproteobacteria bacterium]
MSPRNSSLFFAIAFAAFAACARRAPPPPVAAAPVTEVPLFDDLGDHQHLVTTSSPLAQRYFDQGLRLVYAFNHDEAIRAFQQASELDPDCAMAHWGTALALGPNINWPADRERDRRAYQEIQRAIRLADRATEPERAIIHALAVRYADPPLADRMPLDVGYADAMREVMRRFPDDLDAATLFAEALMDLRPWDYWTRDGRPQPGTLEMVETLEEVIRRAPDHPGANHYYIHAIEASPHPERGIPSAERLGNLMPGAGHVVHMAAHIYVRVGRYADASIANERAISVDESYLARTRPRGVYPMMYVPHNIHFLSATTGIEGRSRDCIRAARELARYATPEAVREMPMMEMFAPTPLFALTRFGRWQQILAEPVPPQGQVFTMGIWHYARGMAFAATGRLDEAGQEQERLAGVAATLPPDVVIGQNPGGPLLAIAGHALQGDIAARRGRIDESIGHHREAIRLEDELRYDEPPPWYQPVRQLLGLVLLTAGRPREAELVYREDLRKNPENGWSLIGLAQSLRAQDAFVEASEVEMRFRRAWANADVILPTSRF